MKKFLILGAVVAITMSMVAGCAVGTVVKILGGNN